LKIEISDRDTYAFWIYLGIGILEAILNETVSPDTGIWTLGMPKVWEPLENLKGFPPEVLEVFQTADELSLIKALNPAKFPLEVKKLIDRLHKELAKIGEPDAVWDITFN
jgi:hypothetical protein